VGQELVEPHENIKLCTHDVIQGWYQYWHDYVSWTRDKFESAMKQQYTMLIEGDRPESDKTGITAHKPAENTGIIQRMGTEGPRPSVPQRRIRLFLVDYCAGLELFQHAVLDVIKRSGSRGIEYHVVKAVAWEIDEEVIRMAESMHAKLPWVVEARGDVRHMGNYLKS